MDQKQPAQRSVRSALSSKATIVLLALASAISALTVQASSYFSLLSFLSMIVSSALFAAVLTGMPGSDNSSEEPAKSEDNTSAHMDDDGNPPPRPDLDGAEILMTMGRSGIPGQMGTIVVQQKKKQGHLYPFSEIFSGRAFFYLLVSAIIAYGLSVLISGITATFSPGVFFNGLAALIYLIPGSALYICVRRCQGRTTSTVVITVLLSLLLFGLIAVTLYQAVGSLDPAPLKEMIIEIMEPVREAIRVKEEDLGTVLITDEVWELTLQLTLTLMPAVTVAAIWVLSYFITFVFEMLLKVLKMPNRMPYTPWLLKVDIVSAIVYIVAACIVFFSGTASVLAITCQSLTILLSPILFFIGLRGLLFRFRLGGRAKTVALIALPFAAIFMPQILFLFIIISALTDIFRLHLFSAMLKRRK